jgi:hypothetical protein
MFKTWKEAHTAAIKLARELNRDVGLWRVAKGYYNYETFTIRSLPHQRNRFGHELQCEVVSPGDPL